MLNKLNPAVCREILENIEMSEPDVAMSIRDQLFTFEDLKEVSEPDLRELVNAIDKKTLMVALKSASEELKAHIYKTMSSRAVEMMKEDSEMMGPVRGKDVAKAQSEMIAIARKLEAEGKIALEEPGRRRICPLTSESPVPVTMLQYRDISALAALRQSRATLPALQMNSESAPPTREQLSEAELADRIARERADAAREMEQ